MVKFFKQVRFTQIRQQNAVPKMVNFAQPANNKDMVLSGNHTVLHT